MALYIQNRKFAASNYHLLVSSSFWLYPKRLGLLILPYFNILSDYEIFDLQYNSSSFIQEISQWNVSNFTSNQSYAYSYCDGIPLLGGIGNIGPNTTFTRTYTNLTNHNLTVFFIEFWIFSTSNTTNDIQITIQNETSIAYQTVLSTKFDQALWISDICGVPGASGLKSLTVYVGVSGINSTATITIENVNMLDSTFLQYGIRNVGMTLLLVPSYSKRQFLCY